MARQDLSPDDEYVAVLLYDLVEGGQVYPREAADLVGAVLSREQTLHAWNRVAPAEPIGSLTLAHVHGVPEGNTIFKNLSKCCLMSWIQRHSSTAWVLVKQSIILKMGPFKYYVSINGRFLGLFTIDKIKKKKKCRPFFVDKGFFLISLPLSNACKSRTYL